MTVKTYILFTVLYSNLEACDIALVLGLFGAGGLTIGPLGVEVDNVFVAVATFNSSRNCRVCWIVRGC